MKYKIVEMEDGTYELYSQFFIFFWMLYSSFNSLERAEMQIQYELDCLKNRKKTTTPKRIVKIVNTKDFI